MIRELAKWIVYRNPIRQYIGERRHEREKKAELAAWEAGGKIGSPPHLRKEEIVLEYAQKYETSCFVETGTYFGEMVQAVRKDFEKIVSIELSEDLYHQAKERFKRSKHIEIIWGDSAVVLGDLVPRLYERTLFWLDGHYSGGVTAKGDLSSPILDELRHVYTSNLEHIVLIDDAREFGTKEDYPEIEKLKEYVKDLKPDAFFEISDDVIRIS